MSIKLDNRLSKLEERAPTQRTSLCPPVYRFSDPEKADPVAAFKDGQGMIYRGEQETAEEFVERVTITKNKHRGTEDLTWEELEEALTIVREALEEACHREGITLEEARAMDP